MRDEPANPTAERPKISDGPFTVDLTRLVPDFLARSVTLDFSDSSLQELSPVLEKELEVPVLFDTAALQSAGILPGEPFQDYLIDAPACLLLNRLSTLGLTWYVETT